MRITIIYDNKASRAGLKADWGFSCLVEAHERRILFDTGAKGSILLGNMQKLNIKPTSIEEVFISHNHYNHTGGPSPTSSAVQYKRFHTAGGVCNFILTTAGALV